MHCPVLPSFLYRAKSQNTGLSGIWQPSESDISIDSKVGGCILEYRDQDISCRSSRLECKLVRELMNHGRHDESSIDVGVDYQTWRDCRFERRRHVSCPSKEMLAYCLLKASALISTLSWIVLGRFVTSPKRSHRSPRPFRGSTSRNRPVARISLVEGHTLLCWGTNIFLVAPSHSHPLPWKQSFVYGSYLRSFCSCVQYV